LLTISIITQCSALQARNDNTPRMHMAFCRIMRFYFPIFCIICLPLASSIVQRLAISNNNTPRKRSVFCYAIWLVFPSYGIICIPLASFGNPTLYKHATITRHKNTAVSSRPAPRLAARGRVRACLPVPERKAAYVQGMYVYACVAFSILPALWRRQAAKPVCA